MSGIPPLKQIIEGAIMAADQPLAVDSMIRLFEVDPPEKADILSVLGEIATDCDGRGFELKQVASGYRFQVRSDYGQWVSRLWEERPARYTRALLETLALIAYKQPITRGDIEEIRGVSVSTNIMRSLLEREWIRVVGHRDVPGRPAIYATTRTFLDYFDLSSLTELPTLSAIKDLDKINEELDLKDEIVEARTIELSPEQDRENEGAEDASLEEVTERVNEIQENIKNAMWPPVEDALDDDAQPDTAGMTDVTNTTDTANKADTDETDDTDGRMA
jgi:segregation and condensation protein B